MSSLKKILDEALVKIPMSERPEWVMLREMRDRDQTWSMRDSHPEQNTCVDTRGYFIEVLSQGKRAYATVPASQPAAVLDAIVRATDRARYTAKLNLFKETVEMQPIARGTYRTRGADSSQWLSLSDIYALLAQSCETAKESPSVIESSALFRRVDTETRMVSTHGTESEQSTTSLQGSVSATAQEQGQCQSRNAFFDLQGGPEAVQRFQWVDEARRVGEEAVELLSAPECPTGVMDILLSPDQMMLQIHESIGHPLELDRILGDERNYAGWSFVQLEDIGRLQYGSSLLNCTFDPTPEEELASYAFDDQGSPAKKEFLIRAGVLERVLGGVISQRRGQRPGVANSRTSLWSRPAIDRMANLNLEPGDSTFGELVGSIERGVWMQTNRSWSIDDFRNKFQFSSEYGKLVENGKITRTVRNPSYRGVSTSFWRSLKKVGDLSTTHTHGLFNCGKGEPNQVIRVGHRSPACVFSGVEVFGGSS